MTKYYILARHNGGMYRAGSFEASWAVDAIEAACAAYAQSRPGRTVSEAGAAKFYCVSEDAYKLPNCYGGLSAWHEGVK